MNGFILAPAHNKEGRRDATGAFHVGASIFQKVHGLPAWKRFENDETSRTADAKGFLKIIREQPGGWDVFAYFGHGDSTALGSADLRGRKGARALADELRTKCNPGVIILLYACNAGAPGGFAEWLAQDLADKCATVYGHLPPKGHTFQNANMVRYPGGKMVIERTSPLWADWYQDFHATGNDLWARFAFMSQEEIETELIAPGGLLGRWEVLHKNVGWHEVFFEDRTVVRTDTTRRFSILDQGKWTANRRKMTIEWKNGDSEEWTLALNPKHQNVKVHSNTGFKTLLARRVQALNINPRNLFHGMMHLKQSSLIKI